MVENYVLAKKLAADKCGEDSDFYPFMVCALYGVLTKYSGYQDLIEDLFMRTTIIFEEGKVEDIIRRNNIELDMYDPVHDDEEDGMTTYGVSNQGHSFYTNEKGEVSFEEEDPFIICSLDHEGMEHFLNTFCHEFSHLIKGEENGYSMEEIEDSTIFIIRTGLAHYVYQYENHFQEFRFISAFAVLDEAINCIQTTDILEEILSLKEFITDPKILSFLNSLNEEEMKLDRGYEEIVLLVRELWKNEEFRNLVEENIVSGNIDAIIHAFNSLMGEDAFEDMSQKLDMIYEKYEEGLSGEELQPYAKGFQEDVLKYQHLSKKKEKLK